MLSRVPTSMSSVFSVRWTADSKTPRDVATRPGVWPSVQEDSTNGSGLVRHKSPRHPQVVSIHLMLKAAETGVKPSAKLVLLCLAESARDDNERRAWPGPETMSRWASVSRARVFDCLKDLTELRLIAHVGRGHKGRRGEYVVFPDGCCDRHGPVLLASSPPDAIEVVDSPIYRTLFESKRPTSEAQRPVSEAIASGTPDASLKEQPLTTAVEVAEVGNPQRARHLAVAGGCEHGYAPGAIHRCPKCKQQQASA